MTASPSLADWNQRIARIVEAADDVERLPQLLVDALLELTPGAMGYVSLFRKDRRPRRLVMYPDAVDFPKDWADGLYVLDPYYAEYRAGRSGCIPLRRVMPPGFDRTEYWRQFYSDVGLVDELIHLTVIPGEGAVAAGFTRSAEDGRLTKRDVAKHDAVYPLVAAFSNRIWSLVGDTLDPTVDKIALDVESAIARFGEELLTPREREVIDLVLRGHDTQSVAAQLSIAADTVKLHRKHAYAKLRVSSQGELFYKFLETLAPGLEG